MNEDEWNVISFLPPLTGSKRNCQSEYFRDVVGGWADGSVDRASLGIISDDDQSIRGSAVLIEG